MTADILAEQVAYYRARASEYDAGAYPEGRTAADRIAATVTGLRITGSVLELACGTGMWTRELARRAAVTAMDSSPETIAIARPRCPPGVRFQVGDVFAAPVTERFDMVFFAFWLSHVPAERFAEFFERVDGWLAPGGRAVFVDEPTRAAVNERIDAPGTARRTLSDGSSYVIVKNFLEPTGVAARLAALGWLTQVADRGDWVVGQARRR